MDAILQPVTDALVAAGIPAGSVRFMLVLFTAPLLCAAHNTLRGATLRHLVSLITGAAACVFAFGVDGCAALAPPVVASYAVMVLLPRQAGALVFIIAFGYLLSCHLATASGDAWKEGQIDFTGSLMVFTIKLVSTAFDVSDGNAPVAAKLSPHQLTNRLRRCPPLLALMSYIFYPGTLLAGPWVSFADYCAFIERTGVWSPDAQPQPPSPLLPALGVAVAGTLCAALHSLLMPLLPDSAFLNPGWVASHGVPFKLVYMWCMAFASRCKYYFVWSWADVACRLGGLGWAGWQPKGTSGGAKKDDAAATRMEPRWDRCRNVDILGVELATSAAELPQAWNTCTGAWLRHYCYERLLARRVPPFAALLVTQATSGMWHGLYAGYGLFFTSSSFMLQAAKVLFRYQRALPAAARKPFALLHWFLTAFHLNYLAATFIAVTLPAGRAAWASVHYAGHISMIVICIVGTLLPPPKQKRVAAAPEAGRQQGNGTAADGKVTPAPARGKRA